MVEEITPPTGNVIPQKRKLPMWATVKASYAIAWNFKADYLRIVWLWLLICTPIFFAYHLAVWSHVAPTFCQSFQEARQNPHTDGAQLNQFFLFMMPATLLQIFFGASIAVAWHRLILRNETIPSGRYLRMDHVVIEYFKYGVLLYFCSIAYMVISFMISGDTSGMIILRGAVLLVGAVISLLLTVRLTIILPAKALQLDSITLKDAWNKTRYNFWRIFMGTILTYIIAVPLIFAMKLLDTNSCNNQVLGSLMHAVQMVIVMLIGMPVMLTFLSLSFQYLIADELAENP